MGTIYHAGQSDNIISTICMGIWDFLTLEDRRACEN